MYCSDLTTSWWPPVQSVVAWELCLVVSRGGGAPGRGSQVARRLDTSHVAIHLHLHQWASSIHSASSSSSPHHHWRPCWTNIGIYFGIEFLITFFKKLDLLDKSSHWESEQNLCVCFADFDRSVYAMWLGRESPLCPTWTWTSCYRRWCQTRFQIITDTELSFVL